MATKDTFTTTTGNSYEFSFETQPDGTIRPYITRMPSYGSRDSNLHATHRRNDGRCYVCRDPQPRTMREAYNVAKAWTRRTDRYIRTGKRFDS